MAVCISEIWRVCRRARRRRRVLTRQPEKWRRVAARFLRLYRARELARAQERILVEGPPNAPWKEFPNIANSTSSGWRQGHGEAYLMFAFWPWWEKLGAEEKAVWVDREEAPDDWRELLDPRRRP
jgi:hypothetical protein